MIAADLLAGLGSAIEQRFERRHLSARTLSTRVALAERQRPRSVEATSG